jgi:uncharacterized delta-60 repeat protein
MTVFALFVFATVASARPGALDRSFGRNGRVMTATSPQTTGAPELIAGVAWGGGGRIVLAGSRTVARYSANGELDRRFGRLGRLMIPSPPGTRLRVQAIATDSAGRLLVASDSQPFPEQKTPGPQQLEGPQPSWVTVTRYLPNGHPDPTFGTDGTVNTTFDLPPPKPTTGVLGKEPFEYQTPSVEVTGLAVDQQDRPILTGVYVDEMTLCYPGIGVGLHGSYVARLSTPGSLDSSFHENGVLRIPDVAQASMPTLASSGRPIYTTLERTQCLRAESPGPAAVSALTDTGQLDPGFGVGGSMAVSNIIPSGIAVDRTGATYLVGLVASTEYDVEPEFMVVRLSAYGQLSSGFGSQGLLSVPRWLSVDAIAIDRRGRILLGGAFASDPYNRSRFALTRLRPSGKVDRSFGHNGRVQTGFGSGAFAEVMQILIGGDGHILAGGAIYSSIDLATGNGVGAARYIGA